MVRFAVFVLITAICTLNPAYGRESENGAATMMPGASGELVSQTTGQAQARDSRQALEETLLRKAEAAFRAGRFFTPVHDNAYDRFHSVLLLNPDNATARSGLQAILLKYAQLVRTALEDGRVTTARSHLRKVELRYPGNELLLDLKKRIRAQTGQVESVARARDSVPFVEEISLSRQQLNQQTTEMKDKLAEIALRLRDTDESVLIYARSDREGRWIYKQLKEAVTGYRVRGDIRISRAPKIRIMPPL